MIKSYKQLLKKINEYINNNIDVDVHYVDEEGKTLLHYAAKYGNIKGVTFLIEKGADFNAKDHNGWTPLHLAAKCGHTKVIDVLIKHRADVNSLDKCGYTPLHYEKDLKTKKLFVEDITRSEIPSPDIVNDEGFRENKEIIHNYVDMYFYHKQCEAELKKLKKTEVTLHEILKEKNLDKLANLWFEHKSIQEQEELKEKYQHYSDILIDKINKVKKHIFIKNNEPIVKCLFDGENKKLQNMAYDKLVEFVREFESFDIFVDVKINYSNIINFDISGFIPTKLNAMSLATIMSMEKIKEVEKPQTPNSKISDAEVAGTSSSMYI
ncbi:ankyrin repeat domain-containing protein [Wolbachia endosymbiont of Pentidionis agamae]|uniref:ankyrin repeat domain-containing protein n=1 Tax=Wolbachia endosymbiont of Pentidionis agamae TaxID=3110435 RepID=UPI002FD7954F